MAQFVTINALGLPTGFFRPGTEPAGAFEISDAIWAAWLTDTAGQRWNGTGLEPYAAPLPTLTEGQARGQRDHALSASDWTQLPDAPLSEAQRAAWAAYRASLRALPAQLGWPAAIVWPVPPA